MTAKIPTNPIPVAIVGANGYAGLELARLLLKHPHARLQACVARKPEWRLEQDLLDTGANKVPTYSLDHLKAATQGCKTVFLATPNEVSVELVPILQGEGVQIIDLSGAHRLSAESQSAHYGLVPWATDKSNASLVANPGCYATSVLMALIPLLKAKLIDPDFIVIDAKSGTSGAGLKAQEGLLFNEVDQDCMPYRIGYHQHLPEIRKYLEKFAGVSVNPHFSTSLLPLRRGIISALYLKPSNWIRKEFFSAQRVAEMIDRTYNDSYHHYPLLKFGSLKSEPSDKLFLSLKKIAGSARTHISYSVTEAEGEMKIYVFSVIDNLLKGAASQAVENWNILNEFQIDCGLTQNEGLL